MKSSEADEAEVVEPHAVAAIIEGNQVLTNQLLNIENLDIVVMNDDDTTSGDTHTK